MKNKNKLFDFKVGDRVKYNRIPNKDEASYQEILDFIKSKNSFGVIKSKGADNYYDVYFDKTGFQGKRLFDLQNKYLIPENFNSDLKPQNHPLTSIFV